MKIVRAKVHKDTYKKDMFVILCLTQSTLIVLIAVSVFLLSKMNSEEFIKFRQDIETVFDEDIDIGGYFTPTEENEEIISSGTLNFVSYEDTDDKEEKATEKSNESEYDKGITQSIQMINTSEDCDSIFGVISSEAVMPVAGTVTSDYGYREHPVYSGESFHSGRDIAAAEGTDIYAVLDGVISETGTAPQAGNYVKIDHGNGVETLYCHCSKVYVNENVSVRKGEVIAAVGETGLATGPHLHFELHENSEAVDPAKILSGAVNVY